VIGLPAAVGLVLLAGPLVATVYGHGRFTTEDVRMTTYALWAYGVGFIGFSLVRVLVPGFYARHEMKLPVRYAVLSLVIGMAVSLALFTYNAFRPFPAAHVVLAASTSLTACLNAAFLYRRLRRDGIFTPIPGWAIFALRVGAATAAMAGIVLYLAGPLQQWLALDSLHRGLRISLVILAAFGVYGGMLLATGLRWRHLRDH
jgi:putative peptidoglycan lipid II flippase